MKRFSISLIFLLLFGATTFGQNVLLTIEDKEVTRGEFERIYLKNNNEKVKDESEIDEYLDLFINFKLKVIEAENQGYDTSATFLKEYNKYLSQLAEPYFTDKEYEDFLIKQAYDRKTKEVRVSYILIKTDSQSDTIAAYNKAMDAYTKLSKGADFLEVAKEMSDAKNVEKNKADAWFSTVFAMPYVLENFAFENKIGDISKPILLPNGYYILKITDIRPAPGEVKASHIYIRLQQDPTEKDSLKAMQIIDSVQMELDAGTPFDEIASKFSEDNFSASKGGDLGWFSTGRMLREFEKAVFDIEKIGDYVGPVRTPVGYHFIKLTGKKKIRSYEEEYEDLKKEISKKPRYDKIKEKVVNDLKKEYNYKQVNKLDEFYNNVDSTILEGKWTAKYFKGNTTPLVTFADQIVTSEDFAKFIKTYQKRTRNQNIKSVIDEHFENMVTETIKAYEITQLPKKNEKFKYLVQEYHDGLLLFDITNEIVWEKAVKDTVGLKNYYSENRNKYYQKINLVVYKCSDEKALKKTIKILKKKETKNISDSTVLSIVNKKSELVSIEQNGVFKEGDNEETDEIIKMMQDGKIAKDQQIVILESSSKVVYLKDNLKFVKGLVTADYQNELEKQWIKELRAKYKVEVNQELFEAIKKDALK